MGLLKHVQELEQRSNRERTNYIKKYLESFHVSYFSQPFRTIGMKGLVVGENIIVDYPFKKQTKSKKILLGAHTNKAGSSPGANDNASGVAVLLGIIENLRKESPKDINVRLVFFDYEDDGGTMAGSRSYVNKFGVDGLEIMVNIDMVGKGNTIVVYTKDKEEYNHDWLKKLRKNLSDERFSLVNKNKLGLFVIADHLPFLKKGLLRSCSLMAIPDSDVRFDPILHVVRTGLNRVFPFVDTPNISRYWHTSEDTSRNLDKANLDKVARAVWRYINY